jgi:hypothetical protein
MIALSDDQLASVMRACAPLDPSKRAVALERVAGELRRTAGRYCSDSDVDHALKIALVGLMHEPSCPSYQLKETYR